MSEKVFSTKVTPEDNGRKARKAVKLTVVADGCYQMCQWTHGMHFQSILKMLNISTRKFKFMKDKCSKNY